MAGLLDPSIASKLTESLNGLYAGGYLAGVFYGLTTHQTFVYFRRSGNDNLYTRLLVLVLWILDTLHAVLGAVALRSLVQEAIATSPLSILIDRVPWALSFSLFMITISDSGVRTFYCYRIWRLSNKNRILTAVAVFPGICACIAGLYCTSKTVKRTGAQALDLVTVLDITLISIVVADSILAGFLCVLLWKGRSGIKRTNSVISTLILYTVTTGLLTSLMAIATLIIMLTMKETFAYVGALYTLSKLYFSSLLATLNRREKIRTQMEATSGIISIPLQTISNTEFKGTSGIFSFKSSDDGTNTRSEIKIKQRSDSDNDPDSQVGGVLGPGLHSKSALQHIGHIEIKVETSDMVQTHSNGSSGSTGSRQDIDTSIV